MVKLVIFDLDGTIIDSIYDLADSVNVILAKYNLETHDTEKYYHFVGDGTLKLIERAVSSKYKNDDLVNKIHNDFLD
ncbi:MAG: HAD hydrolase-like protein, partial [Clostridiales bacterium]|nr:HAD hydrolase-like protein [Clostridiales bacterium]